jgi:hypothetical protein
MLRGAVVKVAGFVIVLGEMVLWVFEEKAFKLVWERLGVVEAGR